ncbi:MAG: hydroxylamine reductase [Deltaproteobacteria bacterium]|nr:hydroxylamine reductase [Deltaproteobacteria bacterium]
MFCWQCEQTKSGEGCVAGGACGKTPETAALQDLLMHTLKGLGRAAIRAGKEGEAGTGRFVLKALFATLTNVDFDPDSLASLIREAAARRGALGGGAGGGPAFAPDAGTGTLAEAGRACGVDRDAPSPVLASLRETALYGLKGLAAYAWHASALGREDPSLFAFACGLLAKCLDSTLGVPDWLALALKTGEANLAAMRLLDEANTGAYGHPEPVSVPLGHRKGPAILVSGHDLKDLAELLEQSEGAGVTVYTHGEMLPAHGYPGLRRHAHLHGHFGTGWQNQRRELPAFPGAVLFTSNCLQGPAPAYAGAVFTSGPAAWPGAPRIQAGPDGAGDFAPVIEKALGLGGYPDDAGGGSLRTGFARNAVAGLAGRLIGAVKDGLVGRFLLVGGCDGGRPGRGYYREIVEKAPPDTVILTLGCGKFRFNDLDLGDIGGIPRLLDLGQCNDAYSAVQIALSLAEAFGTGVNELPLRLVLSWYEQKAVAILLTLLHLGVRNILLGPSLPAFIHPEVLRTLVDGYGLAPISSAEGDLEQILAG